MAQHGGTFTGRNPPQGGAELTIRLPVLLAGNAPTPRPGEAEVGRRAAGD